MAERDDLPLSLFEDVDATDPADEWAGNRPNDPTHPTDYNGTAHPIAAADQAIPTNPAGSLQPDAANPNAANPNAANPNAANWGDATPAGPDDAGTIAAVRSEASPDAPTGQALTHLIAASDLDAQSAAGQLFRNVSFDCRPGALVAVVGPPGSGRSALLLALTGRLRPTGGSLFVAGYDACGGRRDADAIRAETTLARLGSLVGPEPDFTVAMAVEERCLLEAVGLEEGRAAFADICAILELSLDHDVIIATLDAMSRTKLSVALACVAPTSLVALDDIDAGVHDIAEHRLWRSLRRLSDLGVTVVASTSDLEPAQLYPDVEVKLDPGE